MVAESLLKSVFGYDRFKPLQREVIENVLQKRDTLAVMPTGGGKSLCYQIPALIFPGLTVVVSPLIALMKDQVEQLQALGVPALLLNSAISFEDYQENMRQVRSGKVKLLYVAPETLLTPRLFGLLSSVSVDCLTIDEAHCISEWGHDFRPEYRQLVEVRSRFPQAVCLALTATATARVRADIETTLRFEAANEFVASFNRENLLIEVVPKTDGDLQTLQFLKRFPGQSGIIYCFSRSQVDGLADTLVRKGFSARPYHAGLEDADRHHNQELFIRDDVQIIVATVAFGMGINKPNVRFVLHHDLPKSIESYYQEVGRAGRDGLPATCRLLYSYGDVQKLRYFIDQKEEPERTVAEQHLDALVRYAESDVCRRRSLLAYFGEDYVTEGCGMCDNCLSSGKKLVDITLPAQKFLSCVKRTGEIFGAVHLVDVLLGSENQKVLKFNHQALSTYGIGKDLSRSQWLHIGRQLVQKGLLDQSGEFHSLKLTPRAYEVLKSKEAILGIFQVEEPVVAAKKRTGEVDYDPELFEALRKLRKKLADAAHIPPYVVFSDRTLAGMALSYPVTRESLLDINGVGQVKAQRYGQVFLDLILEYCQSHNLVAKRIASQKPLAMTKRRSDVSARHIQVGEAYNNGMSIQDLVGYYQVQQPTILEHLARFSMEGHPLRLGDDLLQLSTLPARQQAAVLEAFEALGPDYLRPVFDRLNGTVNFNELKVLRLLFLGKKNEYLP